ncbi:MAG: DUF1566 domain-containing protein [Leptothrix ochracea]|uniref:Lcl C-terminal domain-containing protein n=1 Tax=Leptothrix ochracea TaxID=735331 RepID=UPI0034E1C546
MKTRRSTRHERHWMLGAVVGWLVGGMVGALSMVVQAQGLPAQTRWTVSSDGSSVFDHSTWLTWARCAVGQIPPDCSGRARAYTHDQALAYAASQIGWRLPNVNELSSLVDPRVIPGTGEATIDSSLFPNTSASWFWSAWPVEGNLAYAWSVNFERGYIDYNLRHAVGLVRLVR